MDCAMLDMSNEHSRMRTIKKLDSSWKPPKNVVMCFYDLYLSSKSDVIVDIKYHTVYRSFFDPILELLDGSHRM